MRNLLRSVFRKKAQDDGGKPVKEARATQIPAVTIAPRRLICDWKDLECRFGSAGELYEQVAKCASELRDSPARVKSDLNNAIRAWRRSVDSSVFIYSFISVGTSAVAVVASAVGFIPVYGQLALGAQLVAQILCIPAAERRHRIARQRLDTANQALEGLECLRGVQFTLKLVQRGRDPVVDAVLHVLLKHVKEGDYVDAQRVKAEVDKLIADSSARSALDCPQGRLQGFHGMKVDEFYQLLRKVKAPLLTKGLEHGHAKGLLLLLKDLVGALAWIPGAIPGFLLECYAGIARGGELAISLLYLSRVVFHSVVAYLLDLTGVADTTRVAVFYVGGWLGYGLFMLTLAVAAAALVLSCLALNAAVENCGKLYKAVEHAERKLHNDASEATDALKSLHFHAEAVS